MNILDIAKRECKGDATDAEVNWLTDPARRADWHRALREAIEEFESQMLYHKTRIERMADDAKVGILSKDIYTEESEKFESWHRKALRYRGGLIKRASEVRAMLDSDPEFDFKDNYYALVSAIEKHRQATLAAGLNPENHDNDLWSVINN